jgi:hypothetical protein
MTKLVNDEGYLWNVKYTIDFPGKILKLTTNDYSILKKNRPYPLFKTDTLDIKYSYRIYYYELGAEIIPLAIKQIKPLPEFVLDVKGFQEMSSKFEGEFNALRDSIKKYESDAEVTFRYNKLNSSSKKILERNDFYEEFAEVTNNHRYPHSAGTTSAAAVPLVHKSEFYLEFKTPGWNLSGSHNILQTGNVFGLKSFGFEFGLRKDNLLNLMEYQNPVLNFGPFFFCDFGNSPFAVDIKILGQKHFNNKKLLNSKKFLGMELGWPVFNFDEVQINKASGVTIDAHILGSLGNLKLPFINFYWSFGRKDFKNPGFSKYLTSETRESYYSLNQVELSLSIYWTADNNNYNKFRLDIGGGSYDIWRVLFDNSNNLVLSNEINKFPKMLPLLGFEYVHSSLGDSTRFGSSVRYFDGRISCGAWLKLLKIGEFEMRIEENYISESFRKVIKDWDHKGSSNMMQLIFRYGLN